MRCSDRLFSMRGNDDQLQDGMFSCVSLEDRIPATHPLRGVRKLADAVLAEMSKDFDGMYAKVGRPSIPPERLFRALLLQVFYSVRSERLLMEQLDYNLLFRWFVGLEITPHTTAAGAVCVSAARARSVASQRRSTGPCGPARALFRLK